MIVFLSTRSVEKVGYVQHEFRRALYHAEEMPEGFIHTIPVKLDDCSVPRRFSRHQWANLYESGAFDRIVHALYHGLQQRGQPIPEPLTHDQSCTRPEPAPPHSLQVLSSTDPSETPEMTDTTLEPSFTNSIGMEFVLIPAGTFLMGSPDSDTEAESDEKPAHRVTISQRFYLGKYPVTQAQWAAVMGNNPSEYKHNPNYPVQSVSWDNVQTFLRKLNEQEGKGDYRLPTEAYWEYACRAGTDTPRYHHNIDAIAWYKANSTGQLQPVGQKLRNAWGLYDMLGNVWEWCHDGYKSYTAAAVIDPLGPTEAGAFRVIRGGSWDYATRYVRAASRNFRSPGFHYGFLGFRCARSGRRM